MKKAFDYLDSHKIVYEFHDYKKSGISMEQLRNWSAQIGWEKMLNRQGLTWRKLEDSTRQLITNETNALKLLQEKTSMIKRPVIEKEGKIITVGFDAAQYNTISW